MARYKHLPIYKQAMDVAVHFEKVVSGFSGYRKYTLGTELRNKSRRVEQAQRFHVTKPTPPHRHSHRA